VEGTIREGRQKKKRKAKEEKEGPIRVFNKGK
jgi:hypothetical protein